MNKSQAILTVLLATSEAEPLPMHVVTARVRRLGPPFSMDAQSCGRSLSQMFSRGRISRVSTKEVRGFRYYMTEEQRARCFAPVVYPHAALLSAMQPAVGGPSAAMVERIRFLERLRGLPAFTGEAVIDAMLGDYRRAHEAALAAEDAAQELEDEAARQAKLARKRADAAARKARSRERSESSVRGATQHEIV